eukprot:4360073-Amphidinium_carterae.1
MLSQTGERVRDQGAGSIWWVLTPTGDVFPEELAQDEETAYRVLSREMERPRGRARRGFDPGDPVIEFEQEMLIAMAFCEALEQVEAVETQSLVVETSGLAGEGDWIVGASTKADLVGKELDEKVFERVQVGNLALVSTASGVSAVAREPMSFEGAEGDARVLPVKWRNNARRRGFQEAVELMEGNEYGDEEMEGDLTTMWYLEKIVGTGLDPVSRHRAWVSDSGIPQGDRSVYEHQTIALVLQTAACRDQLNLGSLLSMEILARRAMLIESAHVHSPGNPDYSHGSDFMGLGEQRGGALVSPGLLKLAASKASERTQIMKEKRKMAEELRLRKPTQSPKQGKGEGRAKQAGRRLEWCWLGFGPVRPADTGA